MGRFVIPSRELSTPIYPQQPEPTKVSPALGEVILRMSQQSTEQAGLTLPRLANVNRVPALVVKDIHADLPRKVDYFTASLSFEISCVLPADAIPPPYKTIVFYDRLYALLFWIRHSTPPANAILAFA
jgi:hypothetical protein